MGSQPDPFAVRMVFLRVARMDRYQGVTGGDTMSGGGSFVADHGFGHEMFNYQPFQGTMYGYVQPPGGRGRWDEARINLTRLGATDNDLSASGVLAVWVTTIPAVGAFVVGWYRNATVYRDQQPAPAGSARRHSDVDCGYYITANGEDAVLLPPDERTFSVPQSVKGGFGQSNIWYADDRDLNQQFRLDFLQYLQTRQVPRTTQTEGSSPRRQPDPLIRQRVEQVAIERTTAHFVGLGYRVDSFEQDNIGWDLTAALGKRELKLEVKGLSGSRIVVELTPNEYTAMQDHRDSYRVCVVTDALTEPCLEIFAYSLDSGQWESIGGRVLSVEEIVAARCRAT
ncbi:MAG TPA: DUF3883 domain-containing protein [Fimbriiglobus sp.]|jgi:hypothetical protein|nr:DUF3883 domain-containing protein [Fimbriiglobus sp.]